MIGLSIREINNKSMHPSLIKHFNKMGLNIDILYLNNNLMAKVAQLFENNQMVYQLDTYICKTSFQQFKVLKIQ